MIRRKVQRWFYFSAAILHGPDSCTTVCASEREVDLRGGLRIVLEASEHMQLILVLITNVVVNQWQTHPLQQ